MAAGNGDCEALRELAQIAFSGALDAEGPYRLVLLTEALTFIRLAAVNGSREDLCSAVFLYGEAAAACRQLGDNKAGDDREALGVLLAETMAEQGDEEMAAMLARAGPSISPGAFREAQRLHDLEGSA